MNSMMLLNGLVKIHYIQRLILLEFEKQGERWLTGG